MLHFGNALTPRAEGIHGAINQIPHRFFHIRDIVNFMKCYLLPYNANLKHKIAQDQNQAHRLHRLEDIFAELHHIISSFALGKVREHIKHFNLTKTPALPPFNRVFTTTMGLPCSHYNLTLLQTNRRHNIQNFRPQ
jgi:hypothetical protein